MPSASFDDVSGARRILSYGVTGAGKSTAAVRAAAGNPLPK